MKMKVKNIVKLLIIMIIVMTVSSCTGLKNNGQTNSNNTSKKESLNLQGVWYYKTENSSATLNITSFREQKLSFELQVTNSKGNTGDVSGTALVEKNVATFIGENESKLTMKFDNEKIQIETTEGMLYYAGVGVSFDGIYTRK